MKVLVLGKGYLGSEFERNGFETWGRDKYQIGDDLRFIEHYDVIINCIGISDTRWCEDRKNFRRVTNVNADLPGLLSNACAVYNAKLVHISTGCLYDEAHRPCKEDDFIVAHCAYTVSKYAGELLCNPKRDLIIRPRLLYSDLPSPKNLLCKLPHFSRYVNEFNTVTCTSTIVMSVKALLDADQVGIFNVGDQGIHTIGEIAEMIGHSNIDPMSGEELRKANSLYLVNNVMSLDKLKQFYAPPTVMDNVLRCWESLNDNRS